MTASRAYDTPQKETMKITTVALSAAFLGCIVAANYVTTAYGMVPVLPGVVATAGTWFAGITFVLRDSLQDRSGRWPVLALIVVGAVLSAVLSPAIALASGVAFLVSETADLAVYTPLRRRGYISAAIASNVVGAFLDTVLFLWIAGFPIWAALPGQIIVKLLVTFIGVVAVILIRRTRREPVTA